MTASRSSSSSFLLKSPADNFWHDSWIPLQRSNIRCRPTWSTSVCCSSTKVSISTAIDRAPAASNSSNFCKRVTIRLQTSLRLSLKSDTSGSMAKTTGSSSESLPPCLFFVSDQKEHYWLVVSTILKNVSQWEGLSHVLWKNMFETTSQITSSTAQGGGGSIKNWKPIGKVGCCESRMAERSHWWTERCLRSPLFLSLSLTIYLPTYLLSICLSIYRSIYLSLSVI